MSTDLPRGGPPTSPAPSLDGRLLRAVDDSAGGQVDDDTVFTFHEEDDLVWARYEGGSIRRGYLVGTRDGDRISFRYVHLDVDGDTAAGQSVDELELLADGRIRLHESWSWDSRAGAGTSILEEVSPPLPH